MMDDLDPISTGKNLWSDWIEPIVIQEGPEPPWLALHEARCRGPGQHDVGYEQEGDHAGGVGVVPLVFRVRGG